MLKIVNKDFMGILFQDNVKNVIKTAINAAIL